MGDLKTAEWFNSNFGPHVNTAALDLLAEIADLRAKLAEAEHYLYKATAVALEFDRRNETAKAKLAEATAACAEMRAALLEAREVMTGMIGQEWADAWNAADTALSRPDLGVGKVLVAGPLDALVDNLVRVVCDCHDGSDLWAHTRRDPEAFRRAVRDALLKKGGG